MASLNQVSIELQVKGEREATQALKRYSNASDKLTRSVLNAAGKVEATTNAWDRANRLFEKGVLSTKGLQAAQTQLARELAVVNGYTKSNGALNTQKALAELKAAQATREAARESKEAARAEQQLQAERERLAAQFNPLYAASQRYETQLNELNRAKALGVVNSQQYDAALEQLNAQLAMGATSASQMNKASHIASRQTNAYGMAVQQAGYQIGDFIVQVQSGTNGFVAFGQQATQLVGILPMLAERFGLSVTKLIAVSSVLGIIIPLATALGAAFMRTRDAADEASNSLVNFEKIQENLAEKTQKANLELEQQAKNLGSVEEAFLSRRISEAKIELEDFNRELENTVSAQTQVAIAQAEALGSAYSEEDIEEIAETIKNNVIAARQEELDRLQETYNELVRIRGIEEGRERSQERLNSYIDEMSQLFKNARERIEDTEEGLRRSTGHIQTQVNATNEYVSSMADVFQNAQNLREELGDAAYDALRLAGVDMESGVDAAAKAAARLAADLNISLAAALAMQSMASKEELVMSQPVVTGPATDRFGVEDLLRMGYTEEYLKFIGKIRSSGSGGGGGGTAPQLETGYLDGLLREAELKRQMAGLSEEEARRLEIINQLKDKELLVDDKLSEAQSRKIEQLLAEERMTERLIQQKKREEQIQQTVSSNIETALMSVVDGTKSVEDAFRGMLRNIILQIYQQQVASRFAQQAGNFITSLFGFASGGVFQGGNVTPFADGGVVGGPTYFPMTNGDTGLMGEAGPEAIMPLKRGKGGKLGVVAEGTGDVTVVQNFNISANGDDSVKRIVREEAPRIAEQAKAAVVDAKRRGGSYGRAFS